MNSLTSLCAALARDVLRDFEGVDAQNYKTYGEKLYALYGVTGIRGEVSAGFPAVRSYGLPALRRELGRGRSLNDAAVVALLELIAQVEDTNLIARSGFERQQAVRTEVKALLRALDGAPGLTAVSEADRRFTAQGLSPGC